MDKHDNAAAIPILFYYAVAITFEYWAVFLFSSPTISTFSN